MEGGEEGNAGVKRPRQAEGGEGEDKEEEAEGEERSAGVKRPRAAMEAPAPPGVNAPFPDVGSAPPGNPPPDAEAGAGAPTAGLNVPLPEGQAAPENPAMGMVAAVAGVNLPLPQGLPALENPPIGALGRALGVNRPFYLNSPLAEAQAALGKSTMDTVARVAGVNTTFLQGSVMGVRALENRVTYIDAGASNVNMPLLPRYQLAGGANPPLPQGPGCLAPLGYFNIWPKVRPTPDGRKLKLKLELIFETPPGISSSAPRLSFGSYNSLASASHAHDLVSYFWNEKHAILHHDKYARNGNFSLSKRMVSDFLQHSVYELREKLHMIMEKEGRKEANEGVNSMGVARIKASELRRKEQAFITSHRKARDLIIHFATKYSQQFPASDNKSTLLKMFDMWTKSIDKRIAHVYICKANGVPEEFVGGDEGNDEEVSDDDNYDGVDGTYDSDNDNDNKMAHDLLHKKTFLSKVPIPLPKPRPPHSTTQLDTTRHPFIPEGVSPSTSLHTTRHQQVQKDASLSRVVKHAPIYYFPHPPQQHRWVWQPCDVSGLPQKEPLASTLGENQRRSWIPQIQRPSFNHRHPYIL